MTPSTTELIPHPSPGPDRGSGGQLGPDGNTTQTMRMTKEQLLADPRFRAPSGDLNHAAARALFLARDNGSELVDVDEPEPAAQVVERIIKAKANAGPDAYLWLHDSGDCILWGSREDADTDPTGIYALGRWELSPPESEALAETGEADID